MECKPLTHQPKHQNRTGNCFQITICDTKLCRRIFLRDKSVKALGTHKRLSTPRIGNWIRSNVRASNDLGHIRSSAAELFLYIDRCMFQCLASRFVGYRTSGQTLLQKRCTWDLKSNTWHKSSQGRTTCSSYDMRVSIDTRAQQRTKDYAHGGLEKSMSTRSTLRHNYSSWRHIIRSSIEIGKIQ